MYVLSIYLSIYLSVSPYINDLWNINTILKINRGYSEQQKLKTRKFAHIVNMHGKFYCVLLAAGGKQPQKKKIYIYI